ncbi:MAG: beta-propeller fold lactonase family protein [Armatimonadetes bacterium]|nr:beta-propeller fold lactonase family protein [Armatimonadota bacterium]MDE2206041.1 beta-propeller fold lactonase family protein [Armatimonadota bacterium]
MKFNDWICIRRRMLLPLAAVAAAGVFGTGGACFGSGGQKGVQVPDSYFVLAANKSDDTITVFQVDQSTGALTRLSTVATGHQPVDVAVPDTNNVMRVVYVLNAGDRTISEFQMFRNGLLQPLSPATIPTGTDPVSFVRRNFTDVVSVVDRSSNTIARYLIQGNGQLAGDGLIATGPAPVAATILSEELCEVNSTNDTLGEFVYTGDPPAPPKDPTATYPVGKGAAAIAWEQGPNLAGGLWVANSTAETITSFPTTWNTASIQPSRITGAGSSSSVPGHPVALAADLDVGSHHGDRAVYALTQEGQLLQYHLSGDDTGPAAAATAVATGPSPSALLPTATELAKPFLYVANSGDGTVWQYTLHNDFSAPTATGTPTFSGKGVNALAFAITGAETSLPPGSGGISIPVK